MNCCRLVSSLQLSEAASVHVTVVIPERNQNSAGIKTALLHKSGSSRAGWKYTSGVLWFDTANTTTAQAGCELDVVEGEVRMWTSSMSQKHYKNRLRDSLFTNEMLFLAPGRKEVQKAVTLLHTCSFTQASPREISSQHRVVQKVCSGRASLCNLLKERRSFVALGAEQKRCSSVRGELSQANATYSTRRWRGPDGKMNFLF